MQQRGALGRTAARLALRHLARREEAGEFGASRPIGRGIAQRQVEKTGAPIERRPDGFGSPFLGVAVRKIAAADANKVIFPNRKALRIA